MDPNGIRTFFCLFVLHFAADALSVHQNDFRYISYQDLQSSVNKFRSKGVTSYSQLLFDVSRNQVLVGARDGLYRLSLSKLSLLESAEWQADAGKVTSCINKGQSEENCHNYIKILLTDGKQIFACGTAAFSPECSWREIDRISNVTQVLGGLAKCPYNPSANVTGFLLENGEYFFGGTTDFSGSDSLVSKSVGNTPRTLRTKQYNSNWLNEPQFVGSFESDKFVYFLFREAAVEYINCGKTVFSRIARVCKNDHGGGHTMLKDNWTTFIKARLNCSVSGDYPFYFNEIQSMSYVAAENIVYATFTTSPNSIAGSAICAFNLTAINDSFNGPFKYQHDMNSAWTKHNVPYRDHLDCKGSQHSNFLLETSKYQLMDSPVQATTIDPLYVGTLERFTHITVDVVNAYSGAIHVIYIATDQGVIKKLSVLPKTKETCIVEIWQAVPSFGSQIIRNMQFLKETSSVYVTTDSELMQISASHCNRHNSKHNCLNAYDPYCGWNEREETCSTAGDASKLFWVQPSLKCPVLNMTIDGGWGSWSEWAPCYHKTPADTDNSDTCLCKVRECNNPSPNHGGKACRGSHVAVANCTVHGAWSDWSAWSACSSTCGLAVKTKSRTCTNPAPIFGGRVCVGQDRVEAICTELPPCPAQPIDGGWGPWTQWSSCSSNCGLGFKTRQRKCNNPSPQNGGQNCRGNDLEYEKCTEHCNEQRKIHTTEWFTDSISGETYHRKRFKITCKAPVRQNQIKIVIRDEGQTCRGESTERCISDENEHLGWSPWTSWSECGVSCGGGTQTRTRYCKTRKDCQGEDVQTKECNVHSCEDSWGCWTEWSSCNVSCGWGVKTRTRTCLGHNCKGISKEEKPCEDQPCEAVLGWGNWTEWSVCNKDNEQFRKRKCWHANPLPHECQGKDVETRMCLESNEIYLTAGFSTEQQFCFSTGFSMFILGIIVGLSPGLIYLGYYYLVKRNKNAIPSSPHYMTAEQNPYIQVPCKLQISKKHSATGSSFGPSNGTVKSIKSYVNDYESPTVTLKRNSHEVRNGHSKICESDKFLYD